MHTNTSAIVKIQAAIIAIVIVVAAVAGVFAYYTYFAPKPSPAPPTAKIPVELAGRYFLKNNPKVILDLLENGRCFYGPSAGKWWVEGDRVIIELSYDTVWLTIKNGTLVERPEKIWVKTTLTPSPTPPKPETPTPFLPAATRVGDFSIDVSKVDRQEDITTLYFAITKVADTDSEGGKLEVTLTDNHGNQYSGTLNVNLGGAPSQVIPLLPTGFTYVDSISITMPRQAPIETIRFGDEPEMGFKDLQLVEPSFKQDFGEMTVEPGAGVPLGKYLTLTLSGPAGGVIGWTLPITITSTEYNPLTVDIRLGVQFPDGKVSWSKAGSVTTEVPGSGKATLEPQITTISQAINLGCPRMILISFADKSTGEHALKLMPIDTRQFPPIPERIAFSGGFDDYIYVMNTDGSDKTALYKGIISRPAWSPDGSKIVFTDGYSLYVINADGTEKVKIYTGEYFGAYPKYPAWSPDGTKIAFQYVGTVYVMNVDGSGITELTRGYCPAWSPDGTKIVFFSGYCISIINADGSGLTEIFRGDYEFEQQQAELFPAWSPDGSKIAFNYGGYYSGEGDIYVMNVDGSKRTMLTEGSWPTWSHDGSKLAFSIGTPDRDSCIYLANADGSGKTKLTEGQYPAWAPAFNLGTQTVPLGTTKSDLVKALKDLREAMLKKLDRDIDNAAIAFTDVKDYWRTKRWADIFTAPLRVLEDTLISLAKAADLKSLTQEANAALDESEAAYQVLSVVMMLNDLQEVGEKLHYGLDGPTYIDAIESMLEAADATTEPPLGFSRENYKKVIENHLYGTAKDTPLVIPRKSTTVARKNTEFASGALQVRSSIAKKLNDLIAEIESRELPKDFPIDEVTAQVKELRQQVVKSMSYSTDVRYKSYLNGQGTYVETKLGAIGQLYRAFGEVAGKVDKKLEIEERVEVLKFGQTVLYTVTYKIPGLEKMKVIQKVITLAEVDIKSYKNTFYADVEEKFYMLPQGMVLSLPVELSNLWMISDDTDQYMRYLLGIELTPTPMTGELWIGSLLPLTGVLATSGENSKVAIDMAVEEVNEFLKTSGAAWTLRVLFRDTEGKHDVALKRLMELAGEDIKFVIGPMFSGEVAEIKDYADANKILVVSQSSTSPALAIPDDYIFRFFPSDFMQGPAIARLMYDDGKRYVIPVWRGDAWGDGLVDAVKTRFEGLGGTFLEAIRYAPEAVEFSAKAADLASKVERAVATYGANQVGVLCIAFAEVNAFFTAAREHSVLWTVAWYGSDGTALSGAMIEDPAVAEFATATRFINPIFAPTRSDKYEKVHDKVVAELGREPDYFAYVAYDIVWALAQSLLTVNKYDSEAVREVLPDVTESIFGASGWIVLDENGDRVSADYDLWTIAYEAEEYRWKWVGTYVYATDSVTWL